MHYGERHTPQPTVNLRGLGPADALRWRGARSQDCALPCLHGRPADGEQAVGNRRQIV